MADTRPRYTRRPRDGSRTQREADSSDAATPLALAPDELATRKWMLVVGGIGLFALVIAAGAIFAFSRDASAPERATVSLEGPTPASTNQAADAGAPASTDASQPAAPDRSAELAAAQSTITALQSELRAAQERADDLDRRLAANEQVLRITTNRAETAEANLAAAAAAQAELQADFDAVNGELTQANADRAALSAQLDDAEYRASAAETRAAESESYAAGLAASNAALHDCLSTHQQALYYTTLDAWGSVAAPMQDAAAICFQEVG